MNRRRRAATYTIKLLQAWDLAVGDLLDAAYRLTTAPVHVLADPQPAVVARVRAERKRQEAA
jgi:hypothetical protein